MTKTNFYCPHCKTKVQSEILELKEKNGKRFALSECPTCEGNISVIIPNSLKVDSKPYQETKSESSKDLQFLNTDSSPDSYSDNLGENVPSFTQTPPDYSDSPEILKLKQEIEENKQKIQEEIEREKVKKFKREAKDNEILERHGIVVVNRGWHIFLGIFFVIVLILILTGIGVSIWAIFHYHIQIGDYLAGFKPSLNVTNVINVAQPKVDISSPISNSYSMPVYINNTVNVRICNGSVC